jgi:hypothetical protein
MATVAETRTRLRPDTLVELAAPGSRGFEGPLVVEHVSHLGELTALLLRRPGRLACDANRTVVVLDASDTITIL